MNKEEAIDQLKNLREHCRDFSEDNEIFKADVEAIDLILEVVNNRGLAFEKLSEEKTNLKHEYDYLYSNNLKQKEDIKRLKHLVNMYELVIKKLCEVEDGNSD